MDNKINFWLALNMATGLNRSACKAAILEFGNPRAVFDAPLERLGQIEGISKKAALKIKGFREWDRVEKEIGLLEKNNVRLLTLEDPDFPDALRSIHDPPLCIYLKGTIVKDDNNAVAIVGTRLPTPGGLAATEKIAGELAGCGITIVSGMARGIDSAAHRGAIKANGRTIAVLGCGINVIYPPENKKLYESIIESGAVISEFGFNTPPLSANFPRRNRIISGLATGVLVAEASLRSGSLITARLALDYGRDVFAMPGSITSDAGKGTNRLIKDGAKLVEDAADIIEELPFPVRRIAPSTPLKPALSTDEEKIMSLLAEPCVIDTITRQTGLPVQKVSSLLLEMELRGIVAQQPGKQFVRRI